MGGMTIPDITPPPTTQSQSQSAPTIIVEAQKHPPAPEPLPPPTPGVKTTEFWRTLMITGVGLALLAWGVINNESEAKYIGGGMSLGAEAFYALVRGRLKAP